MPVQQKFSLQTAWLVVKVLPRGYLLRLACSGRTRLWLEYGENVSGTNVKTKHDLDQQIFEGGARKEKYKEKRVNLKTTGIRLDNTHCCKCT